MSMRWHRGIVMAFELEAPSLTLFNAKQKRLSTHLLEVFRDFCELLRLKEMAS